MGLTVKLALLLSMGASGWTEGRATMYAPGLMERVAANRGMRTAPCMVAHPQVPIGEWLIIRGSSGLILRCRVTDTSQPQHRARHIKIGLVELDYASAKRLCGPLWTGNSRECQIQWKRQ